MFRSRRNMLTAAALALAIGVPLTTAVPETFAAPDRAVDAGEPSGVLLALSAGNRARQADVEQREVDRLAAAAAKAAAERAAAEEAARRAEAERASRAARAADPRALARTMLAERGWGDQFSCLSELWERESNWRWNATNPSSGAYGIPQSLPAEKMASAGADWRTNPATQIRWGLDYIDASYGTPCAALRFWQSHNWY